MYKPNCNRYIFAIRLLRNKMISSAMHLVFIQTIFCTSHLPLYFILNMHCLYWDYVKSCLYFYLSVGFFIENKTHPIYASVTNMKHNWRPVYFLHVFLLKLTCLWHTCIHLNIWPRLDYGAISGDIIINVYLIYFFVFILYLNQGRRSYTFI